MKVAFWPTDTIAQRFALTEILVVGVTLGMVFLFKGVGGFWAQEPFDHSMLVRDVVATARIIEAVPPQMRPSLASAASNGSTRAYWFDDESQVARFLNAQGDGDEPGARRIAAAVHHKTIGLRVSPPRALPNGLPLEPNGGWLLAVRLQDGSWMAFATPVRVWGPPEGSRWLIRTLFLAVSILLITAVAARQFARPIKDLAVAVHEFGVNPRAPPIAESGPRELRQVIRTFNEMQGQIQKFLAHRTLMLAAISHDLRTPLTRMRLRGELIDDPEQQARHFRDVDQMQAMVEGALDFFRDDAVSEPTTQFDLPQLLMTIANDYIDHSVEIHYHGPSHAVYKGRPLALKRAVTNLVENAVKYATPPTLQLGVQARAYLIVVRDRGPGIPAHALGSVFQPYYRVEKSRNRNTGGMGLGLTVVQSIVQGHGGEVTLSNASGGGLEARILMPRAVEGSRQGALAASL
jgi:signal transduction histidine kinase